MAFVVSLCAPQNMVHSCCPGTQRCHFLHPIFWQAVLCCSAGCLQEKPAAEEAGTPAVEGEEETKDQALGDGEASDQAEDWLMMTHGSLVGVVAQVQNNQLSPQPSQAL
jgi:hypothetical protein